MYNRKRWVLIVYRKIMTNLKLRSKHSIFVIVVLISLVNIYLFINFISGSNSIEILTNEDNNLEQEYARKYAVISTTIDLGRDFYLFYLPISALAWRRIGYEPIVILITDEIEENTSRLLENKLVRKTIDYLNVFNIKIYYLPTKTNYENYVGMLARIFVGALPSELVEDKDFIITTDTDLLPVDLGYYNLPNTNSIKILNAFCCGSFEHENVNYQMYPMGHVGMRKKQWRELMNLTENNKLNGETILKKIEEFYKSKKYIKLNWEFGKGDENWYLDQKTLSIAIYNYVYKQKKSNLQKIKYSGFRLDRGWSETFWNWLLYFNQNYNLITDCHSYQENIYENWHILQRLLKVIFSKEVNSILDSYYNEFFTIRKELLKIKI